MKKQLKVTPQGLPISPKKQLLITISGVFISLLCTPAVYAEKYPEKPIRIIVNSSPGGQLDVTTRLIAQFMGETLKQPIIIENKPGADGMLGIRYAKTVPSDGYTLLAAASTITVLPSVKLNPGYDVLTDFSAIGAMVRVPYLMITSSDKPYKSVSDLINFAKSNPEKVSFSSAGNGTTSHICSAKFMQQAGIHMLNVPYKGNAAALPDLIAGRSDMMFDAYGSSGAQIKSGRLRVLAVTSSKRMPQLPNVPTVAEQGLPNFSYELWLGLLAPAGTPKDVLQKLSAALNTALANPKVIERAYEEGTEPMPMSPQEFSDLLKTDLTQTSTLVTTLGIKKE